MRRETSTPLGKQCPTLFYTVGTHETDTNFELLKEIETELKKINPDAEFKYLTAGEAGKAKIPQPSCAIFTIQTTGSFSPLAWNSKNKRIFPAWVDESTQYAIAFKNGIKGKGAMRNALDQITKWFDPKKFQVSETHNPWGPKKSTEKKKRTKSTRHVSKVGGTGFIKHDLH